MLTYVAGASVVQNLTLIAAGHVEGFVYVDLNNNAQFDSGDYLRGDSTSWNLALVLLDDTGQVVQTVVPNLAGEFLFDSLTPGHAYLITMADSTSPAIRLNAGSRRTRAGSYQGRRDLNFAIGVNTRNNDNPYSMGTVFYRQGNVEIPVSGARVIYYTAINGSCQVNNPTVLWETFTELNGDYAVVDWQGSGCAQIVDAAGFTPSEPWSIGSCDGNVSCSTSWGLHEFRDIELTPVGAALSATRPVLNSVIEWNAFLDQNGNQLWDFGEPGLPAVVIASGTQSSQSSADGSGALSGLADGTHTLSITPPPGYMVHGPTSRRVVANGLPLSLPDIALRPAGLTIFTAFVDLDGDGLQGAGESGVGGVQVQVNSGNAYSSTTSPDGRAIFAALADGTYTAIVTAPIGFAAVPPSSITLTAGGAFGLPLHPPGLVSGVVYDDWDGDAQRAADEAPITLPYSLTLDSGTQREVLTMGGRGYFLNVSPGTYTLASPQTAVAGQTLTVTADSGGAAGLPVVPTGVVRGTAWLDDNGNNRRDPWESPLAGITLTLDGATTAMTDRSGRYSFSQVVAGNHTMTASLPDELMTTLPAFSTSSGRGAAVGVAVRAVNQFHVYLPIVLR